MSYLLIYFGVYGGLNALVYATLAPALPYHWRWRLGLALLQLGLLLAPLGVRWLERRDYMLTAGVLSFSAWHWMALALWLASLGLPLLMWNGVVYGVRRARPEPPAWVRPLAPRPRAALLCTIVASLTLWGAVEAQMIRLKQLRLEVPVARGLRSPLRVVLISDVHISLIRGKALTRKVRALVEEARPDLLLSAGDLLDGQAMHLEDRALVLAPLRAPLGKYAVLGNHEWYSGEQEAVKTHTVADLDLLRGEAVRLRDDVVLVGADDPAGQSRGGGGNYHGPVMAAAALEELLRSRVARPFTILLYHQPHVPPELAGAFDLMLSGHTHGGQIYPFGLAVRHVHPYFQGLYALSDGAQLYVSRGTGTWGPSLRVLAPPEITVLDLVPANR